MRLIGLLTTATIVAMSTAAFAQGGGGVNASGTIGPTVTAVPPNGTPDANAQRTDPDAGRYGVPGGVGDPSVGANLTRANSRLTSAASSLHQANPGTRSRRLRR
jgi:hypothetical protein